MIEIIFKPQQSIESNEQTVASWYDPVLTIDGIEYDLSEMPDGATATHPVIRSVERSGSDYVVTILINFGTNAPQATRYPLPVTMVDNGNVPIPPYGG